MSDLAVTVYTKPDCMQCDMTKKWLRSQGVEFEVEDILDEDNLAAVQSLGYMAAPVIFVSQGDPLNDIHWAGFRPDLLKQYLTQE